MIAIHDLQKPDPEYPPIGQRPGDIVNCGIAKLVVRDKKIVQVGFTPMLANKDKEFVVEPVSPGSEAWDKLMAYIEDMNRLGGTQVRYRIDGDQLVLPLDDWEETRPPVERKFWTGQTWQIR